MFMTLRRAKIMASVIAAFFLLVHVFLLDMFYVCGVTPMVFFNVFSIIFYLAMCALCGKGYLALFSVATYLEVLVHMTAAVIYTGVSNDFQITLIGMSVVAMYGEYIGRSLKIKFVPMLPFCILGVVVYIGCLVYGRTQIAPYVLPDEVTLWFNIIWGIIVFVITLVVLVIFVVIARTSERKLEYQMNHDKLTGLPNRYFMADYLDAMEEKGGFRNHWIALVDIDNFKQINDTYGHNCGDYVLTVLGEIFTRNNTTTCCRWGGEEFLLVSDNVDQAVDILEAYRIAVENYGFRFYGQTLTVTITIGMAMHEAGQSVDAWISRADANLYKGKQSGRNMIVT